MISGPPRWCEEWVGRAFDAADRDPGCHCWGLVRRVLAARAGLTLPAYAETSAEDLRRAARHFAGDSAAGPWRPAGAPLAFDVALMVSPALGSRLPVHCGLMVTPRHVLHVEAETRSVIVTTNDWSVRDRIVGFFRHEALA